MVIYFARIHSTNPTDEEDRDKKYEYKFIEVPAKGGRKPTAGETYEKCKEIIVSKATFGWRPKTDGNAFSSKKMRFMEQWGIKSFLKGDLIQFNFAGGFHFSMKAFLTNLLLYLNSI